MKAWLKRIKEPVNALTHLFGAILGLAGMTVLLHHAILHGQPLHIAAFSIFGMSLVLLYLASGFYHMLPLSEKGQLVLQKLDHIMIYVLIAGTYTPFGLLVIGGGFGWGLLIVMWSLVALGVLYKLFWFHSPGWLSGVIYLVMGWLGVLILPDINDVLPLSALYWILSGGLAYTAGSLILGLQWPDPLPGWFGHHEIWHLFVLAGSFCHFWAIYRYLSPIQDFASAAG